MRGILRGATTTKFTCQEIPHALLHEKNGICAKVRIKTVFLQSCDGLPLAKAFTAVVFSQGKSPYWQHR